MSTSRSTLQIVKYLHQEPTRGRSHSIVEIEDKDGKLQRFIRDYKDNIRSGSYGEVYRLKLENDPSKTILAKKEKTRENGCYPEGYNMYREAINWAEIEGFGGYVGDEKSDQQPHIVIMKDLGNGTLKDVRYGSTTDFLKFMWNVLDKIDDFHKNNKKVHYDMTENNILYDESTKKIKFVDFGLTRNIGEEVHEAVRHKNSHSGSFSGYFPPELNPNKCENVDKLVDPRHDVYIVGKMLSRMMAKYSINKAGQPLVFLPSIKAEYEKICLAMQEYPSSRISLDYAIRKMFMLARLNELLENQEFLFEKSERIKKMAAAMLKALNALDNDNEIGIRSLAGYFNSKNQDAFLSLFGLTKVEQETAEFAIPATRARQ